ncbi:hypothetical protein BDN70DRAFT_882651 [Pholiota conissans]|uniref:Uncharacterized protein n=1 Tax=Pholiota conissans TaxID=109636 RepID=A0A9P6CXG7_9AGAR|nr:hypothetical protein BDN70DRAFT_882651 [Pholiota conissans]
MYQKGRNPGQASQHLTESAGPESDSSLLSVVFLAFHVINKEQRDENMDHYAVIRFSRSYEDVMKSIKRRLGDKWSTHDTLEVYAPMLYQGKWIWAKSGAEDWDLVVEQVVRAGQGLGIRHNKGRNYG